MTTGEYVWEKRNEYSWEAVTENESGEIRVTDNIINQRNSKRRLDTIDKAVHRGMMRFTVLAVDVSKSIEMTDFKPSRIACTKSFVEEFIRDFFEQNPLSQLGIIVCQDGIAKKVTSLASNPTKHITEFVTTISKSFGKGDMSLYNALNIAKGMLKDVPTYGSKEFIVVYSALSTVDPGSVIDSIVSLQKGNVRCSAIGLGAEVYVYKRMAEMTGGSFGVPRDATHYRQLMQSHVVPPPTRNTGAIRANFVLMGFPQKELNIEYFCSCHQVKKTGGYICPRCCCISCDIPSNCPVCKLPLISAPHLALSYHHLDPVPTFVELQLVNQTNCSSCCKVLPADNGIFRSQCPDCERTFCFDCDVFIHSTLFVCPWCCDPTAINAGTGLDTKSIDRVSEAMDVVNDGDE
jgi:transcription initiation factor TFIIH subunit 2